MAHETVELEQYPAVRLETVPKNASMAALGLIVLGAAAFIAALFADAERAWRAYQFNWMFFSSIASGAVLLAAITVIARGLWSQPVRRIALSFAAYLPVSFVLFLPMLLAGEHLFPWVNEPVPAKAAYLNMPFLALRNIVFLALHVLAALAFAKWALRPDLGRMRDKGQVPDGMRALYDRIAGSWRGQVEEERTASEKVGVRAVLLALAYVGAMTFVAWDFVMSTEPHWFSTIIAPYYFMGAFLGGIAATNILMLVYRSHLRLEHVIGGHQLHDLGKLNFGFVVFWAYLFWSQYIVIWYGQLPIEQEFLIHRLDMPFVPLAIVTFLLMFPIPFFGLLSVAAKKTPKILGTFAAFVLLGLWLERYLLVYPSHYHAGGDIPFGWMEIGAALPFAGFLLASLLFFAARFPLLQMWRPAAEWELMGGGADSPSGVEE